jgi:hypothetical protein
MEVTLHNLVGPGKRNLSHLNLFGLFFYSHPSGKSTCHFQAKYALVGDVVREIVWTLFTYGGCNKGGSSIASVKILFFIFYFLFLKYYFKIFFLL